MVRKILKIFERQWKGLHEAAYLLGIFALLSQILGLFRDRFLAHTFGASAPLDVYYAAFRIPDFLFVSLASLAGVYALIPFFIEKLSAGKNEARVFLSEIFTALFVLMALASVVLFVLLPTLAPYAAPGFSPADLEEFTFLSRLLLISPFLLGFSNLLGSVTQSLERFFLFALSPILYNLGIIAGIAFLAPSWGIRGVAAGVIVGAFLHLAIQIPTAAREGLFPRFSRVRLREAARVFTVSLPRAAALSLGHFALLVLTAIASLVSQGSVSIFQFAWNLQSAPLAVIGMSYSVAAFPALVRLFGSGEKSKFLEHIGVAARHIIFWSIPIIFLMIILRAQIVRVIFGSGAFNWEHTRLVAAALAVFVVSLLAQNLVLLLSRGYYAAGNTKRPLVVSAISSALIVVSGIFFFRLLSGNAFARDLLEGLLKVEGLSGTAVLALPFAFSLGSIVNAVLLLAYFRRDFGKIKAGISRAFLESLSASFLMALAAHFSLRLLDTVFDLNTFLGIFSQGSMAGLVGIAAGILFLYMIGNTEIRDTARAIRHKFWKTTPPAMSEQEGL